MTAAENGVLHVSQKKFLLLGQVRAEEASLDASVPEANLTFQHLSRTSQLPFKEKVDWFNKQCDLLRVPWDVEHQRLKVRAEAIGLALRACVCACVGAAWIRRVPTQIWQLAVMSRKLTRSNCCRVLDARRKSA